MALSDFEYLPREREEGAPGVVLHPCAYNPSPALSGDEKKYIPQNKSSLEREAEGFKKWGRTRLRVGPQEILFLLRPHMLSNLAWALVLWKLAPHPQTAHLWGQHRKAWCRKNPQRKPKDHGAERFG